MITLEEVERRIREQLRGKLPADATINESTTLEELGLSSLQTSDIVFGLEEDFNVEFDAAKAADAKTLGQLIQVANEAFDAAQPVAPQQAS